MSAVVGLEIAEDSCSSKQVEPDSKLVRKAQRSRKAMLADLDLKVVIIGTSKFSNRL